MGDGAGTTPTIEERAAKLVLDLSDARELYKTDIAEHAISAAVEAERAAIEKLIRERWTFGSGQEHTHSWHDFQDCLEVIRARGEGTG